MNKIKYISLIVCALLALSPVLAQQGTRLTGIVIDSYTGQPLEGAIVSISGLDTSVKTNAEGRFEADNVTAQGEISVWYPGYYTNVMPIARRAEIKVVMLPEDKYGYADQMLLPFVGTENIRNKQTALSNKQKSNLSLNSSTIDQALVNIPGLQLTGMGGLPGEGTFFSLRGLTSVTASTEPLIVIDGTPYMPDMNSSGIITGYSKDILGLINAQDIQNITVLKGADAALYGSMGANGVIMIETDKAVDLDTKVEFIGQYGMDWNSATLPVMGVDDYKSYIGNITLTKYDDMADVLSKFPYLRDDPAYGYNYLYNNNTDWQDEIYTPAFTTDNVLKIKGGDAIAKYDFSVGYKNRMGVLKETGYYKYYARLNADVNLSKRVSLSSTISLGYSNSKAMEQGLVSTNPILAALKKAPIFSPYQKDDQNNLLPDYAIIRDEDGALIENNSVSNPLALVKDVQMKEHAYDLLVNVGLQYRVTDNIALKGMFGMFYNLKQEDAFVPGVTNQSIMPLNNGLADNTVRSAHGNTMNFYYHLNANYKKTFNNLHTLNAAIGVQSVMNHTDYNTGAGYNTASDYYNTLNYVNSNSVAYGGYNEKWNWLNFNATVLYNYNNQLGLGGRLSADASSVTGVDANRFYLYPAFNAVWYSKNSVLKNTDFINKLNVRAEYSMTGNSRFSSSLSKYYYQSVRFRDMDGLRRANVPSPMLKPERTNTFNVGLDLSMLRNRIDVTFDYYNGKSTDLILPVSISPVMGYAHQYQNVGETANSGIELGAQLALIQTKELKWYIGGTIAFNKSELKSLGGSQSMVWDMQDGSALVSEVGSPLYSFYGYETKGVFATEEEALEAGKDGRPLLNANGTAAYSAGDVHFVDQNNDGKIDKNDRIKLGSADPDYYGNFYTSFQYKGFELSATFAYSVGNEMYNALRRNMESLSDFTNQLSSAKRRWITEGQVTDIPRAVYGDPMGNSSFSDRWIEDASFLRMRELMVSYRFNWFNGTTVFVAGENLFTATDYLGLDPETMYSHHASLRGFDYGKLAHPRSVKIGFKLQF